MPSVELKDPDGTVLRERDLPEDVFGAPVNVPLMHQVVTAALASIRAGTHATRTRGDVSGGGRKPWRQKGTGRARQGSIRSPQWTGGGVAHGPHPRDHSVRVNKKMKRAALRGALTDTLASGKLGVVDALAFGEPRTKDALVVLEALGLEGKILIVLPAPDEITEKSFRNLSNVKVSYPGNLSAYDLLYADRVLFTAGALDVVTGEKTPEAAAAEAAALPRRPSGREADEAAAPKAGPASRAKTKAKAKADDEPEATDDDGGDGKGDAHAAPEAAGAPEAEEGQE
jgi:large subunit ribosomal protein L4